MICDEPAFSNWIVQGLSLHEVKELAGHAGIETTERFYLAVRKDVLDRARAASEASRKYPRLQA